MKILYYYWTENSFDDMSDTLRDLGHTVYKMSGTIPSMIHNPEAIAVIEKSLASVSYDMFFSFNYLPFLSEVANIHGIPYVSWVYDCPNWTLFADNITNPCNYLFLFDRNMVEQVKNVGVKNVWHLPLAVNTARLNRKLHLQNTMPPKYVDEISFVGSLYESNQYDSLLFLPKYLAGYFEGIMAAQKKIWGYNFVPELLTPDIICDAETYIKLQPESGCFIPSKYFIESILLKKITSDERIQYLNDLSSVFHVALYTASNSDCCPTVQNKGIVSYTEQMPDVFYHSKINLNITLRSITSGIPLRAIDIMGCCGFLLTNYQPELAEFFEPGVDFVYYEDMQDLKYKARYYLSHDEERHAIASSGWQKVQDHFSYTHQVSKILELVFE